MPFSSAWHLQWPNGDTPGDPEVTPRRSDRLLASDALGGGTPGLWASGEPETQLAPIDSDRELEVVLKALRRKDPKGTRFGRVLREAIDEALDGARTGRWDIAQLKKVEKTFIGMRVELGLSRELRLEDGERMDFAIEGIDVDAKFSLSRGGWEIPPEAWGHLCLLVWCSDYLSEYDVGVVRTTSEKLGAPNRDGKRPITKVGRESIQWLYRGAELPQNLLLHVDPTARDAIFAEPRGQARVDALFKSVSERLIPRQAVETVAQQLDPARRVRTAREPQRLGRLGYVILGQYFEHQRAARQLGLPVPGKSEWVSVRLAQVDGSSPRRKVQLGRSFWAVATDGDPIARAPEVRHVTVDTTAAADG